VIDKTQDPAACPFCELVPDLVNGDCVYHPAIGHEETACPMDGHYFSLSAWNRRPSPASPAPQGGTNYVADHESQPRQFKFANGRRVWITAEGYLDTDFGPLVETPPAPAPGADTREAAAERLLHDMAAYKTRLEAKVAAPLAPDPLPAGAVEFEERLHATILEMVNEWFKVYIPYVKGAGIRPLTNKLAAKIERHFASKPPESGAPAPNLMREADKRASLIRLLWDAHRDIGEWMRLANAIRDEGVLPTNHGRCPTARAILASAAIRGHIAAEIASQDEAQAESVSVANGPIPSQIEPGEKDQDGKAGE